MSHFYANKIAGIDHFGDVDLVSVQKYRAHRSFVSKEIMILVNSISQTFLASDRAR